MMEDGQLVQVVSGTYTGATAEVKEPHPTFPRFYRVWIEVQPPAERPLALLHESQLTENVPE
jgi:hypothetical protein